MKEDDSMVKIEETSYEVLVHTWENNEDYYMKLSMKPFSTHLATKGALAATFASLGLHIGIRNNN